MREERDSPLPTAGGIFVGERFLGDLHSVKTSLSAKRRATAAVCLHHKAGRAIERLCYIGCCEVGRFRGYRLRSGSTRSTPIMYLLHADGVYLATACRGISYLVFLGLPIANSARFRRLSQQTRSYRHLTSTSPVLNIWWQVARDWLFP